MRWLGALGSSRVRPQQQHLLPHPLLVGVTLSGIGGEEPRLPDRGVRVRGVHTAGADHGLLRADPTPCLLADGGPGDDPVQDPKVNTNTTTPQADQYNFSNGSG